MLQPAFEEATTDATKSFNRRRKRLQPLTTDAGASHCHNQKLQPASQKTSTSITKSFNHDDRCWGWPLPTAKSYNRRRRKLQLALQKASTSDDQKLQGRCRSCDWASTKVASGYGKSFNRQMRVLEPVIWNARTINCYNGEVASCNTRLRAVRLLPDDGKGAATTKHTMLQPTAARAANDEMMRRRRRQGCDVDGETASGPPLVQSGLAGAATRGIQRAGAALSSSLPPLFFHFLLSV